MTDLKGMTLSRFIVECQQKYPDATGEFTSLLLELTIAAKIISREVNKAGLVDILGQTGRSNVQGEQVMKLDDFANDTIVKALDHTGHLSIMASEEMADPIPIPQHHKKGPYVFLFDPLDGSSNIDANVNIGTIFGIHRKTSPGEDGTLGDLLQKGRQMVCAGYIVYGPSTMFVYTTGMGVHGFTYEMARYRASRPSASAAPMTSISSTESGTR